jgi:hypothetical protein
VSFTTHIDDLDTLHTRTTDRLKLEQDQTNNMSEEKSKENNISPFGLARSTVKDQPLSKEELDKYTRYFNATLYICLG